MYSPTQQEFLDSNEQFSSAGGLASMGGTPHTTVSAMPVRNGRGMFNTGGGGGGNSYHLHHRQGSFGAASIAMSPPSAVAGGRPISFADPNAQNWFGTSLDSTGSSFGQSPIFGGMVSPSTSTGHLDGYPGGGDDDEIQQRNLQEMFEKRRRRRESHNAVERRRRDNINERIHELSTLLPEHLLENAPTTSNVMSISSSSQIGAAAKAVNKGTILKLSVDHIKELQETLAQYKERVKQLEDMIAAAKRGETLPGTNTNDRHDKPTMSRHERTGSLQMRQQFGNLHIEDTKHV
ncbi:helix-loop-helix DNA-binding domain-containing protein [Dichotomocladium elegans]|nr:helix-loop-helix DNA-binding domain-containing protein [Dichotomocladium elegans]